VGAAVEMKPPNWSSSRYAAAQQWGPHKLAQEHIPFLCAEFTDMIRKGQWATLPARLLAGTATLQLSPLGVVPQREQRPHPICDFFFFGVNNETMQLSPANSMQFG
jgi:hypothetical protein